MLTCAVLAAIGAGIGVLALTESTAPAKVTIRTVTLPSRATYSYMEVIAGHLEAYGQLNNTCMEAFVDPSSLRLSPGRPFDCSSWPPGESVIAAQQPIGKHYNDAAKFNAQVRIGRLDAKTGRTVLGPVVMTFGDYSDTHLESTYGAGSLWVYDCNTPSGSELLRVSATTGDVEARVAMPDICRPVIAAGPTGFWMGPAVNSDGSGRPGLYHVMPRAHHPILVEATDSYVVWILAAGHSTWVDLFTRYGIACHCQHGELERYEGESATPLFRVTDRGLFKGEPLQASAVGNESVGIWTVSGVGQSPMTESGQEGVVRINPDTGRWTYVARLVPIGGVASYELGLEEGQGVLFDGQFFFLEPPYHYYGYVGDSTIVRVTP